MTDTELILEQLGDIKGDIGGVKEHLIVIDEHLNKVDEHLNKVDERLDKMDERMDRLENGIQDVRTELTQRIDAFEAAMDHQINKVYLMAVKNADDIQLLLPYKDKILNVSTVVERVDKLEEHQRITDEVIASHSEAIRKIMEHAV